MNLFKLLCVFVLIISASSSGLSAQEAAVTPVTKQPQPDEGWLVFRGDAGSTGVAKSDLPADLEVLWEYKVPNGAFDGTAVIARGKNDGQETVFIGDMDGVMHAIDLKTGKKKWDLNATISFSSSAAYRNGLIYIGDIDGFLYCIDESGKLKWKFETEGEISSSANFFDGQVLIGSQDSRIYLVDAVSGKEIWKHQTPDQIQCSLTVAGDRAFVAGCDGFLHVIDLKDGHEVGSVDIHSPTQSTPAVLGEKVFFGTEQAEFLAVNWKNVEGEWAFVDDKGPAAVRGCAAVTEGHVIFGARNRQVYSLNPDTGKVNWTRTLKARVESSPVIVGDRVFVGSTDGRLYGLSLKNGETLWEKQFNGGFLSSPAVAFDRLVIATDRGVVYCLGKKNSE
jgi:outer membrane protein assembly factor BamB